MIAGLAGHDLVDHLTEAIASGALPEGTRAWAERVLARHSTPVRVGILGRDDCNLTLLANALLGEDLLPDIRGMPPVQVQHGTGDRVTTICSDGSRLEIRPEEFSTLDPWSLAIAEFSAPLSLLDHVSLLLVPLEGGQAEVDAALKWAGQRCDMVIFCTREADDQAQHFWNGLPRSFLDHGMLCVLNEDVTVHAKPVRHPFRAFHRIDSLARGSKPIERLATALLDHVAFARREDLEGVLMRLERYRPSGHDTSLRNVASVHDRQERADFSALLDPPRPSAPCAADRSGPKSPVAEIISFLSAQADELALLCGGTETASIARAKSDVLTLCSESLEACAEMAMQAAPEVMELFAEATDLAVLMQVESTTEAMTDSVALMLQLRRECEARLCA